MTKQSIGRMVRGTAAFGVISGAGAWVAAVWARADAPFPFQATAPSAMPDSTISAVAYVMIIGVLLAVIFVGAFLILNVGLMSKRDRDRTGRRDPSDVGVLKSTNWPQEAEISRHLPAQEDEDEIQDDTPLAS